MTRRAEITVTINDQTVMCWFSLIVKDVARGVEPHVMWWLLEGIEPSSDSRLSPVARLGGAAVERNGRKNDHLEPLNESPPRLSQAPPRGNRIRKHQPSGRTNCRTRKS